jgi:hypothetical protein
MRKNWRRRKDLVAFALTKVSLDLIGTGGTSGSLVLPDCWLAGLLACHVIHVRRSTRGCENPLPSSVIGFRTTRLSAATN